MISHKSISFAYFHRSSLVPFLEKNYNHKKFIKSWQVYLLQSEAAKDLLSFIREYFRHEAVSSTDNIKDDNKTI